jgi:hypothetical protein
VEWGLEKVLAALASPFEWRCRGLSDPQLADIAISAFLAFLL